MHVYHTEPVGLAVNVAGSFLCAREAVRRMSTREGGAGGVLELHHPEALGRSAGGHRDRSSLTDPAPARPPAHRTRRGRASDD